MHSRFLFCGISGETSDVDGFCLCVSDGTGTDEDWLGIVRIRDEFALHRHA